MNSRISYLAGFLASVLSVTAAVQFNLVQAAEPLKITGPDGISRPASPSQYGPTRPQETFWSIAQQVRPDASVSVYQVMAAIYDANPHAFSAANYNALEKGMILLIPPKEVMLSIPSSQAKLRAEEQDRRWRGASGAVRAQPKAVTKVVKTPKTEVPPVEPKVDPKLLQENQVLSDEVRRLTETLQVRDADVKTLTEQNGQLTEELQSLSDSVAGLKLQIERLQSENSSLKQAAAIAEIEANKPGELWRSLMNSPLMLILGAVLPALLILVAVWLFLRRRRPEALPANAQEAVVASEVAQAAALLAEAESKDEAVVRLDVNEEESLDSLLDLNPVEHSTQTAEENETSPQLNDISDEGQSLDDLWAEAMGEQAELEPELTEQFVSTDDISVLMESAEDNSDDDLNAEMLTDVVGAEQDPALATVESIEDPNIASASPTVTTAEVNMVVEAPLAVPETKTQTDDALISQNLEFVPEIAAAGDAVGPEHGSDAEEDLDALLASFEIPAEDNQDFADDQNDAVSIEASVAELDVDILADVDTETDVNDLDALLAAFEALPEDSSDETDFQSGSEVLSDNLSEQLDISADGEEEQDLDALLAALEGPTTEAKATESSIAEGEDALAADDVLPFDAVSESVLVEETQDADILENSLQHQSASHVTAIPGRMDQEPLAFTKGIDKQPTSAVAKDSGFFDDLKSSKKSENLLEWDAVASKANVADQVPYISDDDLLSAFAAEADDHQDDLMGASEPEMSLEETLAALETTDGPRLNDEDLANFQMENGYIDIDKLLNDSDDNEPEPYRALDMDIGEVDSLIGDTFMVDVDDEENSVNAKLDLARAYIEIDDQDSAKALLKEVALDGNERQKAEAANLLVEID